MSVSLIQINVKTFKVMHSNTMLFFISLIINAQKKEVEVQSPEKYRQHRVNDFCILSR